MRGAETPVEDQAALSKMVEKSLENITGTLYDG
jgi:hypothetical protein